MYVFSSKILGLSCALPFVVIHYWLLVLLFLVVFIIFEELCLATMLHQDL